MTNADGDDRYWDLLFTAERDNVLSVCSAFRIHLLSSLSDAGEVRSDQTQYARDMPAASTS